MYSNLDKIEKIIDDIRATPLFEEFLSTHTMILNDPELLKVIANYRDAREAFASARLDGMQGEVLEKVKDDVRKQQLVFEEHPILKEYFRKERFVELFLDDLQYEFNDLLALKKSSCS